MEALTSIGPLDEFCITATPGDYDGSPPISTFRMDYAPLRVDPDRLALAVYLLYRPWISGQLTVGDSASALLAEAIRDYSGFGQVQLQSVSLRAKHIPLGRKEARVQMVDASALDPTYAPASGVFGLELLRADQASGALRTSGFAAIASNAFVFADSPEREWEVAAAVCCLLAGDFDIADLWFATGGRQSRLARLLRNVGLTLRLPEE